MKIEIMEHQAQQSEAIFQLPPGFGYVVYVKLITLGSTNHRHLSVAIHH